MDYREFEQHVADYVEGGLDSELRRRMDEARASDPSCERLVCLHEQLLDELKDTEEIHAPDGLAERIIFRAENLEHLLAAEKRAFRRGMWLGAAGAALGATALALLLFIFNQSSVSGILNEITNTGNDWLTQVSYPLYRWLGSAGALMESEITLPFLGVSAPVYVLILSAVVTAFLACFREQIMEAVEGL